MFYRPTLGTCLVIRKRKGSAVDLISLEEAAKILLDDPSMMRKTHHPETRKPAFKWLGTRGKSDNGSANTFVLNESKKRISKKNICKYLVDLISLEEAAKILLGDAHDPSMMRTKVRRLYDIANVLSSMNFIEKTHHPETRKPAFRCARAYASILISKLLAKEQPKIDPFRVQFSKRAFKSVKAVHQTAIKPVTNSFKNVSADNVSPDSSSPSKDDLLGEACKKYDEATHLCPTLHDKMNLPISDRAKMRGRTKEAEELWKQALNNWGLELSAIVPVREKQAIVKTAINKFRAAIQLQFDFHRAIYNLGTVLYGLAEDTSRTGGSVNVKEVSSNELFSQSAIYIAAAHALKPTYSLNKAEQKQMSRSLSGNSGDTMNSNRLVIKVDVPDIVSVSACADLTLP
ncbi:unnamed protein product [Camellia sinensis]